MSTRDHVLGAAREIYLADGLHALSMRAVAERVGISATAIYRHFESKEDLLFELCRDGHRVFATYLARGLAGRNARDRLLLTGLGYFDFALDHPGYYALLFVTPPAELGFEKLGPRNMEEGAVTFRMLVDRVRECIDEKVLVRAEPTEIAIEIWGHVHGLASLYLRARGGPGLPEPVADEAGFRRLYRSSLDHLLHGLSIG